MAEISMRRPHGLDDPDEVRARIERLAKQVTSRVGGHWAWSGDGILCEARGARARVGYDATEIAIEVWLPRMLRPLTARLEQKIDAYYERTFISD